MCTRNVIRRDHIHYNRSYEYCTVKSIKKKKKKVQILLKSDNVLIFEFFSKFFLFSTKLCLRINYKPITYLTIFWIYVYNY